MLRKLKGAAAGSDEGASGGEEGGGGEGTAAGGGPEPKRQRQEPQEQQAQQQPEEEEEMMEEERGQQAQSSGGSAAAVATAAAAAATTSPLSAAALPHAQAFAPPAASPGCVAHTARAGGGLGCYVLRRRPVPALGAGCGWWPALARRLAKLGATERGRYRTRTHTDGHYTGEHMTGCEHTRPVWHRRPLPEVKRHGCLQRRTFIA